MHEEEIADQDQCDYVHEPLDLVTTAGWSKTMYAIVKKVVGPASSSVRMLVPRFLCPKKRSSIGLGAYGL